MPMNVNKKAKNIVRKPRTLLKGQIKLAKQCEKPWRSEPASVRMAAKNELKREFLPPQTQDRHLWGAWKSKHRVRRVLEQAEKVKIDVPKK
jgi:hypothetical protein